MKIDVVYTQGALNFSGDKIAEPVIISGDENENEKATQGERIDFSVREDMPVCSVTMQLQSSFPFSLFFLRSS